MASRSMGRTEPQPTIHSSTSEQNTVAHYLLVNSHIGSERAHNLRSYIELANPVTTAE